VGYLHSADHEPESVCAYVRPNAGKAQRDAPTDDGYRTGDRQSGPRRSDGPDDLTPRTYAVVVPRGSAESTARYCSVRPARNCPSVVNIALVIEYWLFYDRDVWQSPTALGDIAQQHDADWEVVLVEFDERAGGPQPDRIGSARRDLRGEDALAMQRSAEGVPRRRITVGPRRAGRPDEGPDLAPPRSLSLHVRVMFLDTVAAHHAPSGAVQGGIA
jgi:hypothetical protein